MNDRRHHRSEDDHTPHRRHSSQHRPSPRVTFAQHQHPTPPLKPLHPTDSRALRSALLNSCSTFKALLLRTYDSGHSPDESSSYKRASGDVKGYYRRLSEPHCEEERAREKTQMAMLWARQLFEMDALLQKQVKEKRSLHDRYSACDHKRKAEEGSRNWADSGWTWVQGEKEKTQYVMLMKVETMPEGFIPPGYLRR